MEYQHGFSLLTSLNNNRSKTIGIYSNYSNYTFSNRLTLNTGIHLLQNNNNFSSSSNAQVLYDINLKYQLGEKSFVSIQVGNLGNQFISNSYLSKGNVP